LQRAAPLARSCFERRLPASTVPRFMARTGEPVSCASHSSARRFADYVREHPDTSVAARRRELMRCGGDVVCEADLLEILLARRGLIDSWASYVQDQRTSDGLFVTVRQMPTRGVEWAVARSRDGDVATFSSAAPAYARLIAEILQLPSVRGPGRV
jgi:hypothetical protein